MRLQGKFFCHKMHKNYNLGPMVDQGDPYAENNHIFASVQRR
jgi:hypothetical protein